MFDVLILVGLYFCAYLLIGLIITTFIEVLYEVRIEIFMLIWPILPFLYLMYLTEGVLRTFFRKLLGKEK